MPTIINNPSGEADSSASMIVGIVVALLLVVIFFVYALPAIRNQNQPQGTNIQVQLPNTGTDNSGGNSGNSGGTGY